jgi:hypothetical protein
MTEPFKTVRDNLTELGLLKPRYLIGPLLAALVYLGLYLSTGYAHGQEPGNLFGIAVVFFGFVFAISTGVGWGLAQPKMALTFISDNW